MEKYTLQRGSSQVGDQVIELQWTPTSLTLCNLQCCGVWREAESSIFLQQTTSCTKCLVRNIGKPHLLAYIDERNNANDKWREVLKEISHFQSWSHSSSLDYSISNQLKYRWQLTYLKTRRSNNNVQEVYDESIQWSQCIHWKPCIDFVTILWLDIGFSCLHIENGTNRIFTKKIHDNLILEGNFF